MPQRAEPLVMRTSDLRASREVLASLHAVALVCSSSSIYSFQRADGSERKDLTIWDRSHSATDRHPEAGGRGILPGVLLGVALFGILQLGFWDLGLNPYMAKEGYETVSQTRLLQ